VRGKPTDFWGKLDGQSGSVNFEWHPLNAHCADVAACTEALLSHGQTSQRLAQFAGLESLSAQQIARLSVLAGFHDIGKFNHGFQAKADPLASNTAGHVAETLGLLTENGVWARKLAQAIDFQRMVEWAEDPNTVFSYLLAVIAHHGQPRAPGHFQRSIWNPRNGVDPLEGIAALRCSLEEWFPIAWAPDGDLLPAIPEFQHAFFGLVTLADWIASDTLFFPFTQEGEGNRMERAKGMAREAIAGLWLDSRSDAKTLKQTSMVDAVLPGLVPRPLQKAILGLPLPGPGSVTILEAETGAGKTEAALFHFWKLLSGGLVDGLYFALPTRTAATQIHQRVTRAVERMFPNPEDRPPVVMAVPGYLKVDDVYGRKLARFEVLWNDEEHERFRYRGWAAENPKRYLVGAIVVGTIDQILLSALQVNHSHMRATALLRHLLVVDEVHASDLYMSRLLEAVLRRHVKAGGHAFLMSATLGAEVRDHLLVETAGTAVSSLDVAIQAPYPSIVQHSNVSKKITVPVTRVGLGKNVEVVLRAMMDSPESVAEMGLSAANKGAKVLILRNTVAACLATQGTLEVQACQQGLVNLLHRIGNLPVPHHARYARDDRTVLDQAIEDNFGEGRNSGGCVAVVTQTVQQSLDLDADFLITDLCPMDVLLQRVGRLHRHHRTRPPGFEDAKVVVLTPSDRDLGQNIREGSGEARGTHGLGTVYEDFRVIEATWRQLETNSCILIPDDNRALVEATVHSEALNALVADLGGPWHKHEEHVLGTGIAHQQSAHFNTSNWSSDFIGTDVLFSRGADERIKTRLGEGDRRIVFGQAFTSPLGQRVTELTLPYWQVRGVDVDATPSGLSFNQDSLRFSLGTFRFVYDRLGLRPEGQQVKEKEDG